MKPAAGQPVALLANVGSRDVTRDGQEIRPARGAGEEILRVFDLEKERLALPILEPALRYLERLGVEVARVVLFATDQPPTVELRYRQTDTLHFATIIRRLLEADRSFRGEIQIRLIKELNPALYDETYPFYQRVLREARVSGGVDRYYLLASGGTPAMNLGLLVAAIERFGDRCDPLYLREGAGAPDPLNLGQQLRESALRQLGRGYLERYQFAAAAEALAGIAGRSFEQRLARYAAARLNFDWDGAWRIANELLPDTSGAERRFVGRLRSEASSLGEEADAALLLGELYHKARVAYLGGAYKEFLVFLFALDEFAIEQIIKQHLGIDFGQDDAGARRRRREQVATMPHLHAFLEGYTTGNRQPLQYEVANRLVKSAYLDFLVDRPAEETGVDEARRDALAEARLIDRRLNQSKLTDQRNRIVHGVGGASEATIARAYNPDGAPARDLLEDLAQLARLAGACLDDWSIDEIRRELLARLDR